MAGLDRYYENKHGFYDDLSDEEEDEDDIDDAGASVGNLSNRISTYPEIVLNSSQYQYYNSPRDLTLPLQKHKNVQHVLYESPEEEISLKKYLGASVSLISLITENLLSHPFVVLRRQCQVHHNSTRRHLIPITLIPVIVHLHRRQGVTTLWKGIGSVLLVRGMTLAVEDVISKFTPWPKEINSRTTMKQFGQHIMLKCISLAVVMPFYAASLVETVQSDIASEKPGVFDIFKEGASRLLAWSAPQKGRMLPVWSLVGPSVSFGLTKYLFGLIVKGVSTRMMAKYISSTEIKKGAKSRDITSMNNDIELYSNIISLMSAEVVFYPFETILHRIQLQGTRTIIDNLDSGVTVVPILTNYESAVDCLNSTIQSEGFFGLYKGFGALILQFASHIFVIKLSKWIINQVEQVMSDKPPPKVAEFYNLDPNSSQKQFNNSTAGIDSTTISRSMSYVSSLAEDQ